MRRFVNEHDAQPFGAPVLRIGRQQDHRAQRAKRERPVDVRRQADVDGRVDVEAKVSVQVLRA